MELQELVTNFGLTIDKADLVLEYLREIDSEEDFEVFNAVMTINTVCEKHEAMTGSPSTCETIKGVYDNFPTIFKLEFGDKYLLGYTDFLLKGGII